MTKACILPEFTDQQAALAVQSLYRLEGPLTRLEGERDLNFRIDTDNGPVVFKISNQGESRAMLECQNEVFEMIEGNNGAISAPRSIHSVRGNVVETIESSAGDKHFCRVVTFIEGRLFSSVNPHSPELLVSLGQTVGRIDLALCKFEHAAIERPLLWNMVDATKVLNSYKPLIQDQENMELVNHYENLFVERVLPVVDQLRFGAIHNDANDNNIVVEETGPWNQRVKGIIDFGDMVYSWIVVDAAVAAAYAMLGKSSPLDAAGLVIKGYNDQYPLTETEISVLFELICMRLCMSVCICAYQQAEQPDNHYLKISEKPAWQVLKTLRQVSPDFAHYVFRDLCGYEPVPVSASVMQWLQSESPRFESIVEIDLSTDPLYVLDSGVASPDLPNPSVPFDPHLATRHIFRQIKDNGCVAAIGKYDEYRLIYSSDDFVDQTGHQRTLHLGIDIFMAAGSIVKAPLSGKVFGVANNDAPLDYGGTLILEHEFQGGTGDGAQAIKFYTLYGHLSPASLSGHVQGAPIAAGQVIAEMGDILENGNWAPHVHFEIITDMLGNSDTFVGVGSHEHRNVWLSLCPDPNVILGIPESTPWKNLGDPDTRCESIMKGRARSLGPSLSLSYRQPIHMARGGMQYLYDATGRKYLDAVNNVPHVGHCHPVVVEAASRQSRVLNTNTRYLYSIIDEYSERLLDKFPDPLNVCFLVNSGSEANDLALRLAGNYTDRKELVIIDHAYHGNLSSLIDISPYKHHGSGGKGPPDNVHTVKMPDPYRDGFTDRGAAARSYFPMDICSKHMPRFGLPGESVSPMKSRWGLDGLVAITGHSKHRMQSLML
jgi:Ser/Thr protein kinase RdoA (MazF antagonist)/murein DD-endopeptidase MepM/ murein hydrolase activator NlpD